MRLRFLWAQTWKGIRANKTMSAAVVLVTFVSLLFVGAATLLQFQIGHLKNEWYDRVEVSAFLCPANSASVQCTQGEATKEQIKELETFLNSEQMKKYVAKVYFETKEEALASFKNQMKDSAWVQTLTAEQMQNSFRVKLHNPEQYQLLADELNGRPGVEQVIDQREQLEPLFNLINRITLISAGLAGVMILTAFLLVPTTIRLSAMTRQEETGIMRLVGASNLFIATPFVLEGVLASLFGSLLAVTGLFIGVKYLVTDWLGRSLQWVRLIDYTDVLIVAPFLILGAVLLAGVTSAFAIKRYMRV